MAERISNEPWVTKIVAAWKEVVPEGTKQERRTSHCKQAHAIATHVLLRIRPGRTAEGHQRQHGAQQRDGGWHQAQGGLVQAERKPGGCEPCWKSVFVFMESEYRSDNVIFWGQYCEQDVWNNFLGLTQASWTVFRLWIANETHHA